MSLRSSFNRSRKQHKSRRANHGHAGRRAWFETLEDRCLLSLTPAVGYDVGPRPQAVVAADFNNDGRLDVATANSNIGPDNVSVLLGGANGTFGPAVDYPADYAPISIAFGDFDDDGNLDLATVNGQYHEDWLPYAEGAVSVMFGNGDGSFQPPSYIRTGPGWTKPTSVAVADFNGDGAMDLAVAVGVYEYQNIVGIWGEARVLLSKGDRTFDEPKIAVSVYDTIDLSMAVADFNDDGYQDIAAGSLEFSWNGSTYVGVDMVQVVLGDGTGNFVANSGRYASDLGTSMVAGDVNGDGDADVVAADFTKVNVRLGNGVGGFEPPAGGHSYAAGAAPSSVVLGDFDRDGRLDVATANRVSNDVSILRGRGDGAFLPAEHFSARPMPTANFNGDGVVDGGDLAQWRGDFGANAGSDADRDGDSDGADFLAWQRQLGTSAGGPASPGPIALTTGDFNGDGWLDLATANIDGNNVSVLFNDRTWAPLPAAVSISIDSVAKQEGTGATTTLFVFTVTLSAATDQAVTMSYRTVGGSARDWAISPYVEPNTYNDYVTQTGTLSFAPGQTTKTITIEVKRDNYVENDEIFYVDLFDSSSNALFTSFYGVGTILNDDAPIDPNTLFVYDIRFESQRGGKDWRAVFDIRSDFNADGIGASSDPVAAEVQVTVTLAGQTYLGTTDANGIFRTPWKTNLGNGNYYANAVDLALTGFNWDPLGLDLENDSDGDGWPDGLLSVG
jgi:hypothetical protein